MLVFWLDFFYKINRLIIVVVGRVKNGLDFYCFLGEGFYLIELLKVM